MNALLKTSGITDNTCPSSLDPQEMGALANYILYPILANYYSFGSLDPSLTTLTSYITTAFSSLESDGVFPAGSSTVASDICNALLDADSIVDCLGTLNTINNDAISNPDYADNPIQSITSVAYHSGMFWSQVKNQDTGDPLPVADWVKQVAGDVGGAMGGLGAGAVLVGLLSLVAPWIAIMYIGMTALGAAAGTLALGSVAISNPFDTSGVTDKAKPSSITDFSTAGGWHNYYSYQALNQCYTWNSLNPSLATLTGYSNDLATSLQDADVVPVGTASIISSINDSIVGGTNFSSIINALNAINNSALSNPDYSGTVVLAIASAAYHSALIWSQVVYNSDSDPLSQSIYQQCVAISVCGAVNGISTSNDDLFGISFGAAFGALSFPLPFNN